MEDLSDIRDSIDHAIETVPNFYALLKQHHDFLRESIEVLLDPSAPDKHLHLARFKTLLEMHGHAEEETLYEKLEASSEKLERLEAYGARDEHAIAYRLLGEINTDEWPGNRPGAAPGERLGALTGEPPGERSDEWSDETEAKARTVAVIVKNHIDEEEASLFVSLTREENARLARDYILKCRDYLMLETPLPTQFEGSLNV